MGNGLRGQARRVVLQQVAPVYQQASGPQKQAILEEFVTATGYAYKYAQRPSQASWKSIWWFTVAGNYEVAVSTP